LSIIDLTTGNQPIANENDSIRIIVNGEFYDFERQRRELEQRGHRFRTGSDSEVALHFYEDLGAHCVQQLRGEFAFVLWDEPNQLLLAARDRFGIKPLYYAMHEGTFLPGIRSEGAVRLRHTRGWDGESFHQNATGPAMPDRTLFKGVVPGSSRALPARHAQRVAPPSLLGVPLHSGRRTRREPAGRTLLRRGIRRGF